MPKTVRRANPGKFSGMEIKNINESVLNTKSDNTIEKVSENIKAADFNISTPDLERVTDSIMDFFLKADIILEERQITFTGDTLKSKARDFDLDSPERRTDPDKSKRRRALVHNQNDGLTINYDQDYPGGVTIRAVDMIEGNPRNPNCADSITVKSRVVNCKGSDLVLDCEERRKGNPSEGHRRALVHDVEDKLVVNYNSDYQGGVEVYGPVKFPEGKLSIKQTEVKAVPDGIEVDGSLYVNKKLEIKEGLVLINNFEIRPSYKVNGICLGNLMNIGSDKIIISGSSASFLTLAPNAIMASWERQTGEHSVETASLELISTVKELMSTMTEQQQKITVLEASRDELITSLKDCQQIIQELQKRLDKLEANINA